MKRLPLLKLPSFDIKLKADPEKGIVKVFDPLRGKYVTLTPEEYVRQHFVNYLTTHLHYPASMIANEVQIRLNDTARRCDTIVWKRSGEPLMIVEYKAPHVQITQDVFDQIIRYNMVLKVKYLVVSNGMQHFCCVIDYAGGGYHFLPVIPDFREVATDFSQN